MQPIGRRARACMSLSDSERLQPYGCMYIAGPSGQSWTTENLVKLAHSSIQVMDLMERDDTLHDMGLTLDDIVELYTL